MLLSTHIIEDVQSVCDQIVVINHGNILFTGTPEQLIQSAAGHVGVFWEKDEVQEKGLHITARVNTSQGIRCRAVADNSRPMRRLMSPPLKMLTSISSPGRWHNEDDPPFPLGVWTAASKPADLAYDSADCNLPGSWPFPLQTGTATTMLSLYLANPAIAGGVVGASCLACSQYLNWIASAAAGGCLMDAAVSPLTMALVRLLALLAVAS